MAQAFLQNTNWISKSFPFTAPIRQPRSIVTCSNQAVATSNNQAAYWSTINTQIEAHLTRAIPIRPPLVVFEPMHHLAFSAPKTTASALCVAACEIVGGHREEAMMAASALHVMHAATYIHEHLPLTDRRVPIAHKSAINHAFGPNIELLTADGFIPFAFELLASSSDHCSDEDHAGRILRVMGEIASVMGSEGIVAGQYEKFLQTQRKDSAAASHHDAMKWIDEVIKKTEGGLHGCGAACGAILGGGNEDEIEKLRRFGLYAGMIQGILLHCGDFATGNKKVRQKVDELRGLALNQLNGFDKTKVETISTLLEAKSCNAA